MDKKRGDILLMVAIFTLTLLVGAQCEKPDVAAALTSLLRAKHAMAQEMSSMKKDGVVSLRPGQRFTKLLGISKAKGKKGLKELAANERARYKTFVDKLQVLKQRVKEFYDAQRVSSIDVSDTKRINALKIYTRHDMRRDTNNGGVQDPLNLLSSFTLTYSSNHRAAFLFHKIRRYFNEYGKVRMDAICQLVKTSKEKDPHALPDFGNIAIKDICLDPLRCSRKTTIYSNKKNNRIPLKGRKEFRRKMAEYYVDMKKKYQEEDVSDACTILTSPDKRNRCDLQQALPMMAGLLRFEVNEMIYQNLCPKNCENGKCDSEGAYKRLINDINRLIGFTASIGFYYEDSFWPTFFKEAISRRAFSRIDVALNMVEAKKDDFEISSFRCHLLNVRDACPFADMFRQYIVLKKMKEKRTGNSRVKDLRQHSKMNHAEMIRLQNDDLKHVQLLGTIRQLDNNLKASVKGISKYFEGLAKYDEDLAAADVGYIASSLEKFERSLTRVVEPELFRQINQAMLLMQTVLAANLAQKIAQLAIVIATNSNPLKVIFGGPDISDVLDRADAVADATADLVRGTSLVSSIQNLADDVENLDKAFSVNSRQLESLDKLVQLIRNGTTADIGADGDKFLKDYEAYSPTAERSKLEKNNALWSAFKDSICELLYGDVGVAGAGYKSIAAEQLVCEKLEGTLAQYFTLREQIFDFQFELVDSLAAAVRGNIAKRFAQDIGKGTQDLVDAKHLMTGFFLMQYKIQKVSSTYCDVLEYKQLGKPVAPCATTDGLFRDQNIKELIAYADNTPYNEVTRDVYIPTRAQAKGDINTGIVDLQALSKGQKAFFKIPVDQTWLQKHKWLLPGETGIPFIKSFKLYLPHKAYDSSKLRTTRVTLTSVAGSSVTTINPSNGVVYILSKAQNTYRTIYEEGNSNCPQLKEIDNLYSLCRNLPKVCDKTNRIPGQSLLPTILSTFSVEASIYDQGTTKVTYDAPSPGTSLLLRAKVVLKMPLASTKKSDIPQVAPSSGVVMSEDGCCKGQYYRSSLNDMTCSACPRDTTAYHGGLFCQINEKKTK